MKEFNRKDVYSWSDPESAKKYVEKKGYFGNSFQELVTNVNNNKTSILWNVFSANDVHCIFEDEHDNRYGLFLPMDKVKDVEEPKKWRAFTLEEFDSLFQIGNVLFLRKKEDHNYIIKVQFIGVTSHRDQVFISLGNYKLTLQDWFCSYELNKNKMWQPFGVLEDE